MDANAVSTYFKPETDRASDHEPSPELDGDRCQEGDCGATENPPSKKKVILWLCCVCVFVCVCVCVCVCVHP